MAESRGYAHILSNPYVSQAIQCSAAVLRQRAVGGNRRKQSEYVRNYAEWPSGYAAVGVIGGMLPGLENGRWYVYRLRVVVVNMRNARREMNCCQAK